MKDRRIWFYSFLVVVVVTSFLLATGSNILTLTLDQNNSIPLGTFITWSGMISLPASIFWGAKEFRKPTKKIHRFLARCLKLIIILALFWVPISYLLAGNLSFSFSEKESFQGGQIAMKWFWRYTYGLVLVPVLFIILIWISSLFSKSKK